MNFSKSVLDEPVREERRSANEVNNSNDRLFKRPLAFIGGATAVLLAIAALLAAFKDLRDQICAVGIPAPWCQRADNVFELQGVFGQRDVFRSK